MATSIFKEYFKGYEILGELGRGNARVLKARSIHTNELVAIKHFAFNTEPDTLRRFQRESEIMKSIQHDNIVKIIEVHLDAELPYIVMQLVEGGDLRSLLKTYGTLDVPTVIRLAHQMTEAMDAIHTKAIVHRDVKPENIMYHRLPNGELQFLLTDFGIAKLREQSDAITATGASMLTYEYASPEQFNQSRNVSTPTDYYSLGVVLYECITGNVPFEYEQGDLLFHINRVISAPIPVPRLPDGRPLPPSLQELLEGLLTKQCLVRISTSVSIHKLLKRAMQEELQRPHQLPALVSQQTIAYYPQKTAAAERTRSLAVATLLVLVICVAVFFSWTTLVRSNAAENGKPAPLPPQPVATKEQNKKIVQKKQAAVKNTQQKPIQHSSFTSEPETETEDELPADESANTPPSESHSAVTLPKQTAEQPQRPAIMPPYIAGIPLVGGRYFNDFSEEDSLWDTGKDENSEYSIADGKYTMRGLDNGLSYSTALHFDLDVKKDFSLSASAVHWGDAASDPFGINFCGDEKEDAYFVFYITSNGHYSIGIMLKGEWAPLTNWKTSSNIHPGAEMNTLTIEKQAGMLRFLINDKVEKTMPFNGGFGNYFGLRVDGAQAVSFDQFIVKGTP